MNKPKIVKTKSEFDWHCKRAKLIMAHVRKPHLVQLGEATHGTLCAMINGKSIVLQRPELKGIP